MNYPVDVTWPGHRRSGVLTTEHRRGSDHCPVLLLLGGQPHLPAELPPRAKIIARWHKESDGPMWSIIQKAIDAGYPVEIEPTKRRGP